MLGASLVIDVCPTDQDQDIPTWLVCLSCDYSAIRFVTTGLTALTSMAVNFGETKLFVQDRLVERFFTHYESDQPCISYDFLTRNFDGNTLPIAIDSEGRQTVRAPIVVSTPQGVHVAIIHMAVEADATALAKKFVGMATPMVALGQDWWDATDACMNWEWDGRDSERVLQDHDRSWADERGAWFSWAHYTDPDDPSTPALWPLALRTLNILRETLLRERGGKSYCCGIISTTPAAREEQMIQREPLRPAKYSPASAADIPPELFTNILAYIDTDERGGKRTNESHTSFWSCSLVCSYWAKECRNFVFMERRHLVESPKRLQGIRSYVASRGRPSRDVKSPALCVEQNWLLPSWCHKVYTSRLQNTRNEMVLSGPIPDKLPSSAYRSPHWSLPRTLPSCFLNFFKISLNSVHFPALSDFATFIRHFALTKTFEFSMVTWDLNEVTIPSHPAANRHLVDVTAEHCRSNDLIQVQTRLVLDRQSLIFYQISALEQVSCMNAFAALGDCMYKPPKEREGRFFASFSPRSAASPHILLTLDVPVLELKTVKFELWFLCQPRSSAYARDVEAIVFGTDSGKLDNTQLEQVARRYDKLHAEVLWGQFPSLTTVFLYFKDYDYMRHTLTVYHHLKTLSLATKQDLAYRIVCHRSDTHPFRKTPKARDRNTHMDDWVEINPATMKSSGKSWPWDLKSTIDNSLRS